jgi:glycosyltransferase involved in cell wall biosynthesis
MTGAVRRWSEGLVHAGAEVDIAFDEGKAPISGEGVNWIKVRHAGPAGLRTPIGLKDVLRGSDLLVLHSGWTLHNLRAASMARRLGVPYLLEPRGAYDPHIVRRKELLKRLWWAAMERDLVTRAAAIHVFFDTERVHLEALGYTGPVVVASNGVERPDGARWDGGTGGYVLWLGRFDPEHKGLDLLLEGLQMVPRDDRPSLRIHGPDWRGRKMRVRRMVSRLGLEGWATVGDAVYGEAKRNLLSKAQGFVYPSRWDACPNSVLEAVSIGVPTLVTSYPLGRFLASRGAALLAEPNPEGLAPGLRSLCSAQASEVGRKGSQVAAEELTWDQVARSWLTQVEAIL